MKISLPLFLLIGVGLRTASAQAPLNALLMEDGGRQREFVVANDQVATIDSKGNVSIRSVLGAAGKDAVAAQAEAHALSTGKETEVVLYEKGCERDEFNRRILTKSILVELRPGTDVRALAAAVGAKYEAPAPVLANAHFLRVAKAGQALNVTQALRSKPGVISANPQLMRRLSKRWIPNDPLFSSQWHLRNTGQSGVAGMDINVTNTWDTYKGTGVRIGIIDDGVEVNHPDLRPNMDFQNSYDWAGGDTDPSPDSMADSGLQLDFHGTFCAGVAAGAGNNGIGISGVAPLARIAGMRIGLASLTDVIEAKAFLHKAEMIQIKSNSWGPEDNGKIVEGPGTLAAAALQKAATSGRGGKGTIFVWAGGNGRQSGDNANYDGFANSIYTISVAATNNSGTRSVYSEPGACHVVCAPGGTELEPDGTPRGGSIATTDLVGNQGFNYEGEQYDLAPHLGFAGDFQDSSYTQTFEGTSAAAPMAAGVVTLMLEANPNLGWRDVQEILMKSATKISPLDEDWIRNGAGQQFNHNFGAGMINAGAAVNLAKRWQNLPARRSITFSQSSLNAIIRDNDATGISRTFAARDRLRVEHVTMEVDISHTNRGQLEVLLISPRGTVSRLAERHGDTGDDYKWTFMSVRNWGEDAQGVWRLKVIDRETGAVGKLNSARLTLFGS